MCQRSVRPDIDRALGHDDLLEPGGQIGGRQTELMSVLSAHTVEQRLPFAALIRRRGARSRSGSIRRTVLEEERDASVADRHDVDALRPGPVLVGRPNTEGFEGLQVRSRVDRWSCGPVSSTIQTPSRTDRRFALKCRDDARGFPHELSARSDFQQKPQSRRHRCRLR